MSQKANQFRIGLFIVGGTAILLTALFLFGIRSAFQRTYEFETYVTTDVEGLSVGSPVELRGVTIGKVKEIGFSWLLYDPREPRCVVVRCEIRQSITPAEVTPSKFPSMATTLVEQGMRAVLQTQAITGSSIITLQNLDPAKYPPLKFPWKPKYFYVPSAPSELGRMLKAIDQTLANLQKFDIERLVNSLDRTLVTANTALQKLGELDVKGISHNANQVLAEASGAVTEIKGLVADARTSLRSMRLGEVSQDATRAINDLDARLTALLDKLNAIDVRSLNDTLAGTREAARNLNDALEELKRYPSGFILGAAPPPAKGLEKEKK
ncbi:MAG TPA: MlaD family protein [Thermoanaerobaculia bacterium]|nr:MlaD family protein [Thermoanaerobaculia bacterium]